MARNVTTPSALVISSGSGATFRIAPRHHQNKAVLEVLDVAGEITQVRLSPDDMRRLAAGLLKVAALLESTHASADDTQP